MDILDRNCSPWINEFINTNTTIEDINEQFRKRNTAGIIFTSALIPTGVIGNLLVIFIFGFKFNKSTYRVYVLCLAFLDSINCCFTMPFVPSYLLFMQIYPSDVLCKIGHFVGFYIGVASPFTLVLIAVDRYNNVCKPLKVQMFVKKAKLSCLVINIIALVIFWHVPLIYGVSERKSEDGRITLHRCFKEDDWLSQKITWWLYIFLTVLTVLVSACLLLIYFIIMLRIRRKSKYFSNHISENRVLSGNSGYASRSIQTSKTTFTFFIITTVYILSCLIHHSLALILHVVPHLECRLSYIQGVVFWTFFWTIFINNIANPFIYGLSDSRFRNILKSICRRNQ